MKRTISILMMAVTLLLVVPGSVISQKKVNRSKNRNASHLGSWQLASYKYGQDTPAFINVPEKSQHIKLITDNYFTWVITDTTTKKVYSMAGGRYTLNGNTYIESIDYGMGMDAYLGHRQTFTIKVEGDMFFLSGKLNDSYLIEEIWQRVK